MKHYFLFFRHRIIALAAIWLIVGGKLATAQEFNAQVRINTPKLQTVDPKVFKTLETALTQLVNTTAWTTKVYEPFERIECTINLNITEEVSATTFKADLAIQATRPIYGSSQNTVLFSYQDKQVQFAYEEYQPLEFTRNAFNNNLTSIISYYCYVVLGLDGDSFSLLGGADYFREAQNVINTIPPSIIGTYQGWQAQDGQRNRYWLMENLLSPRIEPMRRAMYEYHLQGLDLMSNDPAKGRIAISNALTKLQTVDKAYPNSMIMQIFANSKRSEIIQIFIAADAAMKKKVQQVMLKIDATNASSYQVLM